MRSDLRGAVWGEVVGGGTPHSRGRLSQVLDDAREQTPQVSWEWCLRWGGAPTCAKALGQDPREEGRIGRGWSRSYRALGTQGGLGLVVIVSPPLLAEEGGT